MGPCKNEKIKQPLSELIPSELLHMDLKFEQIKLIYLLKISIRVSNSAWICSNKWWFICSCVQGARIQWNLFAQICNPLEVTLSEFAPIIYTFFCSCVQGRPNLAQFHNPWTGTSDGMDYMKLLGIDLYHLSFFFRSASDMYFKILFSACLVLSTVEGRSRKIGNNFGDAGNATNSRRHGSKFHDAWV